MNKAIYFITLFFFVINACQKEETVINYNNSFLGVWKNPVYTDSLITFDRAAGLQKDSYGILFKEDNKIIERKNIGWCGTPPITYFDYTGDWKITDSLIYINVGFWGGTASYEWKILEVTNQKLKIKVLKTEYPLQNL